MKPTLYADISNIARYDNEYTAKIKYINLMYNCLKNEYRIIGIADWGLYNWIDYARGLEYYLGRRIIIFAPPEFEADVLLIECAVKSECLILTNDRFRDHIDIVPSKKWLKRHQVPFDIEDGEFIIYLPE